LAFSGSSISTNNNSRGRKASDYSKKTFGTNKISSNNNSNNNYSRISSNHTQC